jgi:hypothetical protein
VSKIVGGGYVVGPGLSNTGEMVLDIADKTDTVVIRVRENKPYTVENTRYESSVTLDEEGARRAIEELERSLKAMEMLRRLRGS